MAGLHDVDHGLVGDERVVPSGCDFEGDDAQRGRRCSFWTQVQY